ncbi:hypothetical protein [Clostridium thailandense]
MTRGDLVLSFTGKSYYKDKTEVYDKAMQEVGEPNSTLTIQQQKG